MIQIQLAFDPKSKERFDKRLTFIQKAIRPGVRKALAKSGIVMLKSVNSNFESQGRPMGWAELRPITISKRKKQGRGAKILQDTGRLKRSISMQLGDDFVKVGTNVKYAPFLHFGVQRTGGYISGKRIPPRPFIMFQDEDREQINDIFGGMLNDIVLMREPV